ncbi:MAG: metal ABC transporter ATP-binding protein [Longimonas sp.]|uniref:metal ABC transporter ATP-binding protein n=1 Tax=Longimonas sp. TaxID=2039626 RepID=UPI00335A1AA4
MAASPPPIQIDRLTVQRGAQTALRDVSLTVDPASFVAVVGPNGAGKTTLLHVLLGLINPTGGHVRVLGHAPGRDAPRIGYVPQVKTLDRTFPAEALDLVCSGLAHRWPFWRSQRATERARAALDTVGAASFANALLSDLSGGQLQRVYLARCLVHEPELLLLDEPATGVDATGAADLYELLDAYQAQHGATIVMVTHDWNAAYHHATSVLLLDKRCVSYGPPEEALGADPLREAFGHVGHAHAMLQGGGPAHD